jgi:hypothetical protein
MVDLARSVSTTKGVHLGKVVKNRKNSLLVSAPVP